MAVAGAAAVDLCFHASAFPHRLHVPTAAAVIVLHHLLPLFARRQLYRPSQTLRATDSFSRVPSSAHEDDDDGIRDAFLARQSTFRRIQSFGVIACLHSANEGIALHAGRAALDGRVSMLEVTMTASGAIQAGTVLTWHDAEQAKGAGATSLASPVTDKILQARRWRASCVKIHLVSMMEGV